MLYFNRDGSTSSMCGNGLRCFCAFCEQQAITKLQESVVLTGDGYKYVVKTSNSPAMWKINMGKENTYPSSQYVLLPLFDYPLTIHDITLKLTTIFLTNMHTIIFLDSLKKYPLEILGKYISSYKLFPHLTNVDFVEIIDENTIHVITYEKGCGITLSCGSGASASALCAYKKGYVSRDVHVLFEEDYVDITIDNDNTVYLTGPALYVGEGTYCYKEN